MFHDKHRKKATRSLFKRTYLMNIYQSRYQRRCQTICIAFLAVILFIYVIMTYVLPEQQEPTLSLDDEQHLFIRLFKENDPHRKHRRPFRILSGSLHYFRVLPQSWPDRIAQMKKAGLNTIETYVPWNLHEPESGKYQFTDGFADLASFLKLVHENEMFTIVRPSGYICAEWEWGGLPSWLLNDPTMKIRSTHEGFLKALKNYYSKLLPILAEHQYNRHGLGSIIAFQIENEYGSYGQDKAYLEAIRSMYIENGLTELFFTSDGPSDLTKGSLDDVWGTVNFQRNIEENIEQLAQFRPKHHLMITEYWTGWFDYWGDKHQTGANAPYDAKEFESDLETILLNRKYEISINFYMFFGGTNFGLTSGGHHFPSKSFAPLVTSYDYDAPMTEAGDPSEKFYAVQRVLKQFYEKHPNLIIYNHERSTADHFDVEPAIISKKVALGKIDLHGTKTFEQILQDDLLTVQTKIDQGPMNMEQIQSGNLPHGTSQGFIVYTSVEIKDYLQDEKDHLISIPAIADNAIVLVNGDLHYQSKHTDNSIEFSIPSQTKTLTIIVENMGRINFGPTLDHSRKGILDKVFLDKTIELKKWTISALQFRMGMSSVSNWQSIDKSSTDEKSHKLLHGPQLFNFPFEIQNESSIGDTYLSLGSGWTKGIAFINGFNLGRYWNVGPQQTLFIPGAILVKGFNNLQIFELYTWTESIELVDRPVLDA